MLIIFDLDDTLIDTSGSITPHMFRASLQAMVKEGLPIENFEEEFAFLRWLDRSSTSGRDTLAEYLALRGFDEKFLTTGNYHLYEVGDFTHPIQTTDFAQEVLRELSRSYTLAIVSHGDQVIQERKLKKAGIDTSLFSRIIVCKEPKKKPCYQELIKQMGLHPFEVVVCGDRIERDLTPAKELGCKTVYMRWGRGLGCFGSRSDVDFAILHLKELKDILVEMGSSRSLE